MAYRSWLKDVKRLEDLGNHLINLDWPQQDWEKRDLLANERWIKRLNEPLPVDQDSTPFFGSRLHDGWIIEIARNQNAITVQVHDLLAQVFAEELSDLADVTTPATTFPVSLNFKDVRYANGYRPDSKQNLRHTNWLGSFNFNLEFSQCANFGYDWFFQQEERLQWVCEIRYWQSTGKAINPLDVYVVIDCAEATAIDLRGPSLARHFPPIVMNYWTDIVEDVKSQSGHFDFSMGPLDYVLRRLDKYNVTQNQLAQEIRDFRAANP